MAMTLCQIPYVNQEPTMYQIEHFELNSARAIAFQLKTDCVIRVTTGRLWLTLQGRPNDVWLQAGDDWNMPLNGKLWLSAEPLAMFQIARPIAEPRRLSLLKPPPASPYPAPHPTPRLLAGFRPRSV
jgi:Protein of unknown function (DUF2917)